MTAVEDPRDDLLTDIAALGKTHRTALDPSLEWNGIAGQVDREHGSSVLDSYDLRTRRVDFRAAGRDQ